MPLPFFATNQIYPTMTWIVFDLPHQVSEKRMVALQQYLAQILTQRTIQESDVLYTFLHAMPRDQHDSFLRLNAVSVA